MSSLNVCLTGLRAILLDAAAAAAGDTNEDGLLRFCCALARQCFINEYVFDVTRPRNSSSSSGCANVWCALASGGAVPRCLDDRGRLLTCRSIPLPGATRCSISLGRPGRGLLTQQVREPRESGARAIIPHLTPIADDVSLQVKQQYEENPYPRWVKPAPARKPKTAAVFRRRSEAAFRMSATRRRHPARGLRHRAEPGRDGAPDFEGAQVPAIDLSLASLCYAKRQALASAIDQYRRLVRPTFSISEALGRTFDIVEASGVLHHMADPWAGWRVLLSLLRPGGFMRVGLYSKIGRWDVNAARALIAGARLAPTIEDIRQSRQAILALDEQAPARQVVNHLDFFTASECRDMLFHVQEHQMTLAEIAAFIAENDAEFVGLQVEPMHLQRFVQRFPHAQAGRDLDLWQTYEADNPSAFTGMYQFWIRKNRAADPQRNVGSSHRRESIAGGAAAQVRLDQQLCSAAEAHAIDLEIFQHALDVVARLGKWDALDPVDRVDLGIARIAISGDPFLHAAAPGIVAGEGHDVRAAIVGVEVAELRRAQRTL